MKIEELKEAREVLTRVLGCHKTEGCNVTCDICPNNFFDKEEDRALDTAITVIGDVIKQMERMQNAGHVSCNV